MVDVSTKQLVNWFELPATDIDRAIKFYTDVFGVKIEKAVHGDVSMGIFDHNNEIIGGSLVQSPEHKVTEPGVVLTFSGGDDLEEFLKKVEPAGGTVLMPKTMISPQIGFMARFKDTEGNVLGLHSKG